MSERTYWLAMGALALVGPAISYGVARLGEPQSAWLWCTTMGLC